MSFDSWSTTMLLICNRNGFLDMKCLSLLTIGYAILAGVSQADDSWCTSINYGVRADECYKNANSCPDRCETFETGLKDCPFGDRASVCTPAFCQYEENWSVCCYTCREFMTTRETTLTPTTATDGATTSFVQVTTTPYVTNPGVTNDSQVVTEITTDFMPTFTDVVSETTTSAFTSEASTTRNVNTESTKSGETTSGTTPNVYTTSTSTSESSTPMFNGTDTTTSGGVTTSFITGESTTRETTTLSSETTPNVYTTSTSDSSTPLFTEETTPSSEATTPVICADINPECGQLLQNQGRGMCYEHEVDCCATCSKHQSPDPLCKYGDKTPKCSALDFKRRNCYVAEDVCCETCTNLSSFEQGCEYGDRSGAACLTMEPRDCYNALYEIGCCETCHSFRVDSTPDCKYGDRKDPKICAQYVKKGCDKEFMKHECCDKCATYRSDGYR